MDPPIDNADPIEEANEALKEGLRSLASEEWEVEFRLAGKPSIGFVRAVTGAALRRIQSLEKESLLSEPAADHFERFLGFAATVRRENTDVWMGLMLDWLNGAATRFDEEAYFELVGADHFVLRR